MASQQDISHHLGENDSFSVHTALYPGMLRPQLEENHKSIIKEAILEVD